MIDQGVLVVLDGAKALRKAVRDVFGVHTPVQRCIRHKERNVLDHLPEHQRDTVRRRLRAAWALDDHGQLKRTLASTNPCESMIETVRRTSRNVKRWKNGDMCLRWTAAGMLEAEQQFRKIVGFNDLAKLAIAVERDVAAKRAATLTSQPSNAPSTSAPEVAATTV